MQYVSKHTLHIKTTCVNTSFITAYHSVWAYQPIAIRRFLGGRKDYHPKPCDLLNSCEKKSSLLWVSLSIIHNRVDKVIRIAPMGSVRGNRQGRKKFATNPMGICFYRSVFPWITCCPCSLFVHQPQLVAQYTHTHARTHTHTKALSFNLHASFLYKQRSDHTHWAVSLALIRLFVLQFPPWSYPCFVHCHSTGIMGCFHHAGTSTEAVREMQRRPAVLLLSSNIDLSSHELHSLELSLGLIVILLLLSCPSNTNTVFKANSYSFHLFQTGKYYKSCIVDCSQTKTLIKEIGRIKVT